MSSSGSRVEANDVYEVIDTDAPKDTVTGYIEDAHLEVEERIASSVDPSVDYSQRRMNKIEKYLAAHLVRFLWDRQQQEFAVADVDLTYSGAFGEGLTATSPGQVVLDTDIADVFSAELEQDETEGGRGAVAVQTPHYSGTAKRSTEERAEGAEKPIEYDHRNLP